MSIGFLFGMDGEGGSVPIAWIIVGAIIIIAVIVFFIWTKKSKK